MSAAPSPRHTPGWLRAVQIPGQPRRRRWPTRFALGAAAALAGYLGFGACVARVEYPGRPSRPRAAPLHRRGAIHAHTERSDGLGTPDEVARAAKAAGLDFVAITDHNLDGPNPPRYVDGVLAIDGVERTTPSGHRVELPGLWIAAHPLNRRRPYTALDDPALTGLEVLSGDDLWRDALAAPHRGFLPGLLAYPFAPNHALLRIVRWPTATIERWMQAAAVRPRVGTCSVDAHGTPRYERAFGALQIHVLLEAAPTGDPEADARALLSSVARGRVWCAIEILADGGGFEYVARDGSGEHALGSEVPLSGRLLLVADLGLEPPPPGARLWLYRGTEVALERPGGRLEYAPTARGVYRVEAEVEGRSLFGAPQPMRFLYSNPIYVR